MDKVLSTVRRFVDEELRPLEPLLLSHDFGRLLPALREKRERVRQLTLLAPHLPRDFGGLGLSLLDFGRVSEILGRSPLGHYAFNCQAPDIGNMELLLHHGTAAQKAMFLEPLARGEMRSCFAMTEPDHAGSNPVFLSTSARREGGEWVIRGHKWFTSSAEGAAFAIVMAVTDPGASPHARASQILVPTDTPGFRRLRNIPVMGHAGEDYWSQDRKSVV